MSSDYAGNAANTLPGTNQDLKMGTKFGVNKTSMSNRVQPGRLRTVGAYSPPAQAPTQAQPLGLTQND